MFSNKDEIDVELENGSIVYGPTTHSSYSTLLLVSSLALCLAFSTTELWKPVISNSTKMCWNGDVTEIGI